MIPPTQKRYESIREVIIRFYSRLCIDPKELVSKTDLFKTYLVLAPNAMLELSENEFNKTWNEFWNEFDQTIETEVKNQEIATCTECGKKFEGIWAVDKYWFKDDALREMQILLRCLKCESVYCSRCYLNLKNWHTCKKCGEQMKEIGPAIIREGFVTFIPNPILIKQAFISDIKVDQKGDNLADTLCEVTYNYKYKDIVQMRYGGLREIALGDRGKVICQFTNKAVKIGNEWRLIAAKPGSLQAD